MGRPPIVKTPQAVIDGAVAYIEHCEQRDGAPCLAGLARWLGYAHDEGLRDLDARTDGEFPRAVKAARALIQEWWVDRLARAGGASTAGSIFALKNLAGWTDRQEVNQTVSVSGDLESRLSSALLDRGHSRPAVEPDDSVTH